MTQLTKKEYKLKKALSNFPSKWAMYSAGKLIITEDREDLASFLTERQKDIFLAALRYGYFEYPRKINQKELAKKLDMALPTLSIHLSKMISKLINRKIYKD